MDKVIARAREQLEQRKRQFSQQDPVPDLKNSNWQLNSTTINKPVTKNVREILKEIEAFNLLPPMLSPIRDVEKPSVTFSFPECISRKRQRDSGDAELMRMVEIFALNIENLATGKYQPMDFSDFKEIDFAEQEIWRTFGYENTGFDDGSLKIKLKKLNRNLSLK